MKLVFFTDSHLKPWGITYSYKKFFGEYLPDLYKRYEDAKITVVGGDFIDSPFLGFSNMTQFTLFELNQVLEYLKLKNDIVLYVPGNHEIYYMNEEEYSKNDIFKYFTEYSSPYKIYVYLRPIYNTLILLLPYVNFSIFTIEQYLRKIDEILYKIKPSLKDSQKTKILIFSHLDITEFYSPEKAKYIATISLKDIKKVIREYYKKAHLYLFNGHIHQYKKVKISGYKEAINIGTAYDIETRDVEEIIIKKNSIFKIPERRHGVLIFDLETENYYVEEPNILKFFKFKFEDKYDLEEVVDYFKEREFKSKLNLYFTFNKKYYDKGLIKTFKDDLEKLNSRKNIFYNIYVKEYSPKETFLEKEMESIIEGRLEPNLKNNFSSLNTKEIIKKLIISHLKLKEKDPRLKELFDT